MNNQRKDMGGNMQPGKRSPAPDSLALVQDFVNTKDCLSQRETLLSPDLLRKWLVEHDFSAEGSLNEEDLEWACMVREALRSLLRANNGAILDAQALEILNQASNKAGWLMRFQQDGSVQLVPTASGLDQAIAQVLAQTFRAMQEGTWSRLKACRNEACQWIYYDISKNHSGTWCTMSICGSREKARAYRHRHQDSGS
jgi:predicted RNA-binding Zn ribbon-like protein